MDAEKVRQAICDQCDAVKTLLLAKNREYGNSALEPIGIFSNLTAEQQIDVRIDDKLKRIQTIKKLESVKIHEDTEADLIGYLILKRVARVMNPKAVTLIPDANNMYKKFTAGFDLSKEELEKPGCKDINLFDVIHGTSTSYKYGCRCKSCKKTKRKENKKRNRKSSR